MVRHILFHFTSVLIHQFVTRLQCLTRPNFDGTVVVDKPLTVAGMTGREIIKRGRIGSGDAVVETDLRAQFFSRGNRYYQLVAAGRRGAIQAADLDLFFASFKPDA